MIFAALIEIARLVEDSNMGLGRAVVAAKAVDHRRDKKEAKKEEKEKAPDAQKQG